MKQLLIIFLICTVSCTWGKDFANNKIIGGQKTEIENHPYQVSLRYNDKHICGGSILNENTILTAAHCVLGMEEELEELSIRVGSSFHNLGTQYFVSSIHPHEDFGVGAIGNNDVAIVKLQQNLTYSDQVSPIALMLANRTITPGIVATVTGWGTISTILPINPRQLRKVDVAILSNEQCQELYKGVSNITSEMLCARKPGRDACTGDSGGPLERGGWLVGVVSWGNGCADFYYPGVYANITALRTFIDQYL